MRRAAAIAFLIAAACTPALPAVSSPPPTTVPGTVRTSAPSLSPPAIASPSASVPPAALARAMILGPIQRLTERVGWVTTGKGLSRTKDGGVSWEEIVVPSARITELRMIDELRG